MLVDLDLRRKRALVVGGGKEAELKALKLSDAGAHITVIARRFTAGLKKLGSEGRAKLVSADPGSSSSLMRSLRPKVVFISTGKPRLDSELASTARSLGILVCVVDAPRLNDFNMPAIAKIGPVRVALSSGGKSPAMMRILRMRIEEIIRPEDLLQVDLQHAVRRDIAKAFASPKERKEVVYDIIADEKVSASLRSGDMRAAMARAKSVIRDRSRMTS